MCSRFIRVAFLPVVFSPFCLHMRRRVLVLSPRERRVRRRPPTTASLPPKPEKGAATSGIYIKRRFIP
jgi:hypothetical protein